MFHCEFWQMMMMMIAVVVISFRECSKFWALSLAIYICYLIETLNHSLRQVTMSPALF